MPYNKHGLFAYETCDVLSNFAECKHSVYMKIYVAYFPLTESFLFGSFSFQVLVEKMGFPEEYGSSSGHGDPQRMLAGFFPIFLCFLGDDF